MLPPTLRLTILRRLSFLSEDTLQELRVASILGSGFSLADLWGSRTQPPVLVWASMRLVCLVDEAAEDGPTLDAFQRQVRDG